MPSAEPKVLRQRLKFLIRQRAGSMDSSAVAAASRQIHGDLTATLAPLISATGVEALLARAFDLAKREFPTGEQSGDHDPTNEPFTQVSLWLEWQLPTAATDAAAAMFATFAELLTTLIGEPLTMQYLRKAWTDGFSDGRRAKRKKR